MKRNEKTQEIRKLNDQFRRNLFTNTAHGVVNLTSGVAALAPADYMALLTEVSCFEDFNTENDPYGEHDFGAIDFKGTKYFFKIDYYDTDLEYGSEDPADPNITCRAMTIMRADEY